MLQTGRHVPGSRVRDLRALPTNRHPVWRRVLHRRPDVRGCCDRHVLRRRRDSVRNGVLRPRRYLPGSGIRDLCPVPAERDRVWRRVLRGWPDLRGCCDWHVLRYRRDRVWNGVLQPGRDVPGSGDRDLRALPADRDPMWQRVLRARTQLQGCGNGRVRRVRPEDLRRPGNEMRYDHRWLRQGARLRRVRPLTRLPCPVERLPTAPRAFGSQRRVDGRDVVICTPFLEGLSGHTPRVGSRRYLAAWRLRLSAARPRQPCSMGTAGSVDRYLAGSRALRGRPGAGGRRVVD